MPSVQVNSANIQSFGWAAGFDIENRKIIFDASSTVYNGSGQSNVLGISFSLVDSVGLPLISINWNPPQIVPSVSQTYTLDLTSLPINFLFQDYQWIGYIQDADGTVYSTLPILKNICQPTGIVESGYVPGSFQILPDCINNVLTVKEFTLLIYNNAAPISVTKSGTLYYPTGTISPLTFTGTPFQNNVVYTGNYNITNTTIGTYDLGDGITVLVSYYTNQNFPVVCANYIGDITCCLTKVYNTYLTNCENEVGKYALQQYNATMLPFSVALAKQINGQDASFEVAQIKKMLNCDCGSSSVGQNEITPTNPAVNSIVLTQAGGITIPAPTITGNTKTYIIASNSIVVAKGDTGDLAFTITTDTSTQYLVRYLITFNYDIMAGYILNAIAADPTLANQLNSLITVAGGNIVGLDGKCIIDLTTANYSVSQLVNSSTLLTNIVINGNNYTAPANLFANNTTSVASWLNTLALGVFTAVVNSNELTIQSVGNTNTISTITFTTPNITKQFAATNATLVQVLQAIINSWCAQTDLQVALANNLNLCTFDYMGNVVTTTIPATDSQNVYNAAVASAICNLVAQLKSVASVTCSTLTAIFIDRPTVSFGSSDRMYGTLGGNCASLTDQQIANMVFAAVGKYADVQAAFCAINCSGVSTCPDISNTNISIVGGNIAVYGVSWATSVVASQTVTVRYRVSGTITWTIATNALLLLPNGNISGSSPYYITGVTAGTSYDIWIQNNCGGGGFTKSITTPTGSVYSGNYLLDNIIYNICGDSTTLLYSRSPFAIGVQMFTDVGLTVPLTGYGYITIAGSNIFTINSSTGFVLSDTGTSCANGTAGTYILGNDSSTICGNSPVTLYTNGAFSVGQILYADSALTTPQTGYSFVVFSSGTIYTVNSGTGAVTGTSGLSCNNYTLSPQYNFSIVSVTGTGIPYLPPTGTIGNVYGRHGVISGNLSITISGTIVTPCKVDVTINNSLTGGGCQVITGSGTYTIPCSASATDQVRIAIDSGAC